jgi:hypothetical protein
MGVENGYGGAGTVSIRALGPGKCDGCTLTVGAVRLAFDCDGVNNEADTPPVLRTAVWQHVVGTFDGAVLRVYVDSALLAEKPMVPCAQTTAPLVIGGRFPVSFALPTSALGLACCADDGFNGAIDDVRVFNQALAAVDVAALFAGGRA